MEQSIGFETRYQAWLKDVDRWRALHDLTRKQTISVLARGHIPADNRMDDLIWAEFNEFVEQFEKDEK